MFLTYINLNTNNMKAIDILNPPLNLDRLCELNGWIFNQHKTSAETVAQMLEIDGVKASDVPPQLLIDIAYYKGLEVWGAHQDFESKKDIEYCLHRATDIILTSQFRSKKVLAELYPNINDVVVGMVARNRRSDIPDYIAEIVEKLWLDIFLRRTLAAQLERVFSTKPDKSKYDSISKKIAQIWGFSDVEIDAFRFFVCQVRNEQHNPSLNKGLYIWSKKKQTGKTTIAKALVAILNGETTVQAGGAYESNIQREMQMNAHDLPLATISNAIFLDEAMPKDTYKTYGRVKSLMTSNSCVVNPKYQKPRTLPARRNYIITSNDDMRDFVQDDSERRFVEIRMEREPKQMTDSEIFKIWLDFAQNCEPETSTIDWYNTFKHVEGVAKREKDFYRDEILYNSEIYNRLSSGVAYPTIGKFYDLFITGKPTRQEKDNIKSVVVELFGPEDSARRWNRAKIIDIINIEVDKAEVKNKIADMEANGYDYDTARYEVEEAQKLPF